MQALSADSRLQAAPAIPTQVANYLEDQIVTGALVAGQRVPEQSVCKTLGVSRGSVREALLLLQRRHLVQIFPRRGAVVTPLTEADVRALYDMFIALVGMLARRTAKSWLTASELEPFQTLLLQMERAAQAPEPLDLLRRSFRFALLACDLIDNPYLAATLNDLIPAFSRSYYRALTAGRSAGQEIVEFIDSLLVCVVERRGDDAEQIVRAYGRRQCADVLETFAD